MLHPPDVLNTLDSEWCLGPLDPLTLPREEKIVLTEPQLVRQAAREGMPSVESMHLLQDFETWAERVLSDTAWAYYRSAADEERSKLLPFPSGYVFI
jgi:L-lactate dehydrogenase (cytochrome)